MSKKYTKSVLLMKVIFVNVYPYGLLSDIPPPKYRLCVLFLFTTLQIQSRKLAYIMEILRRAKSSYYSSFIDVCLKVDEGKLS